MYTLYTTLSKWYMLLFPLVASFQLLPRTGLALGCRGGAAMGQGLRPQWEPCHRGLTPA